MSFDLAAIIYNEGPAEDLPPGRVRGRNDSTRLLDLFEQHLSPHMNWTIAGSYAAWLTRRSDTWNYDLPGDCDLFFDSLEQLELAREKLGPVVLTADETSHTINLTLSGVDGCNQVQLIKPNVRTTANGIESLIMSFDMTVCAAATTRDLWKERRILVHPELPEHLERGVLMFLPQRQNVVSNWYRSQHYAQKGFTLPVSELVRLFGLYEALPSESKTWLNQQIAEPSDALFQVVVGRVDVIAPVAEQEQETEDTSNAF